MLVPETPCPERGLVPWRTGIWPITKRFKHPVLKWLYTIHEREKDGGLVLNFNVSQEDIVRAMDQFAKFKLKQAVQISPTRTLYVQKRRWDFQRGTMWYLLSDGKKGAKTYAVEQQALIDRIKSATEEAA